MLQFQQVVDECERIVIFPYNLGCTIWLLCVFLMIMIPTGILQLLGRDVELTLQFTIFLLNMLGQPVKYLYDFVCNLFRAIALAVSIIIYPTYCMLYAVYCIMYISIYTSMAIFNLIQHIYHEIIQLPYALIALCKSGGRCQVSTAKVLQANCHTIKIMYPYEDQNMTLINGYSQLCTYFGFKDRLRLIWKFCKYNYRNQSIWCIVYGLFSFNLYKQLREYLKIHSNVTVPADIVKLVWKFYGQSAPQMPHYVVTYEHANSIQLSMWNYPYIEVLKHEGRAIPTMLFGHTVMQFIIIRCIICLEFLNDIWSLFGHYWIGTAFKVIFAFCCWPMLLIEVYMACIIRRWNSRLSATRYFGTTNYVLRKVESTL